MGRWRSGAPLVLAPEKDDPALGADPQRNNDFNYAKMDPHGYAVPLGSHIRRMNPRDTAVNMNRRRMIRRGGTYGPPLPDGAPDDGVERGIAAFIGCASLVRQFEFAQNVWVERSQTFTSSATNAIRSSARRTARSNTRSRSGRSARQITGPAGIHDREGRRLLLPSRHPGAAIPRGSSRDDAVGKEDVMAEAKIYVPTTEATARRARTTRFIVRGKHTPGRRRVSIYVCWSFPGEANRDVSELDNRFSTMTEVRRVEWPFWEGPEWADPMMFQQGIAGALELFFRAWMPFQQLVAEVTGHVVPVFQRVDQAGYRLPLDERVLEDADTLLVFGLDHLLTEQEASADEIDAVSRWLAQRRHVLDSRTAPRRRHLHRPERTSDGVRASRRRAGAAPAALRQVHALADEGPRRAGRESIRSAPGRRRRERRQIAPLTINRDLDTRGWLEGVTNFSFHKHLPHYAVTTDDAKAVHVLGRQPIDLSKPHPFTEAGNREFNSFVWMPPAGDARRRGPARRLDDLQHAVRRGREPEAILEEPRDGEVRRRAAVVATAGDCCLASRAGSARRIGASIRSE